MSPRETIRHISENTPISVRLGARAMFAMLTAVLGGIAGMMGLGICWSWRGAIYLDKLDARFAEMQIQIQSTQVAIEAQRYATWTIAEQREYVHLMQINNPSLKAPDIANILRDQQPYGQQPNANGQ